jgi:hypothetical protein
VQAVRANSSTFDCTARGACTKYMQAPQDKRGLRPLQVRSSYWTVRELPVSVSFEPELK